MTTEVLAPPTHGPSIDLFGRTYPVALPRRGDPRLAVAAVIISVQILGQTVLGFNLSIAQILISIGVAGGLDLVLVAWEQGIIAWPASALLTGNGVALIMRVPGTEHGDWWSPRGWPIFASTAAVAVLSKYVTRVGGRPLLNPSNGALVVAFLLFGSNLADPQDLWWGPWSLGLALTYVIIVGAGVALTRRIGTQRVVWPFVITYATSLAIVAASGHSMTARWSVGPVTGWSWWWIVVASPEVFIFLFFMITDPPTAAKGKVGGAVYGAAVGLLAATLMAAQGTEFATKVALLGALTMVCLFRPLIERLTPSPGDPSDDVRAGLGRLAHRVGPGHPRVTAAAMSGVAVLLAAAMLTGAGMGQRTPVSAAEVARPDVSSLVGTPPKATLDPSVAELIPGFDQAQADQLVNDLAADLVIEAEAIDAGEPAPLASALIGPRLEAARVAIDPTLATPTDTSSEPGSTNLPGSLPGVEEPAGTPPTPGQRVGLKEAKVTIVRTSDSPQALPSLAVLADGTADDVEFSSAFVMTKPGDSYLLVDVVDPTTLPGS